MVSKWKDLIESTTDEQSAVIDIPSWTSHATLDAIGEGTLLTLARSLFCSTRF